jgi:DNA modification methylase
MECLDVTITSPPYWNIKNYGVKNQIGFGQSYNHYLRDIEAVFRAVYSATKPTGSLWIVSDTFKQDGELRLLPFDISARLRNSGWVLQDIIIWQKDRSLPWSHQGKLRNIFEYVAFYSKSPRFKYDVSGIRDIGDIKDYWIRYPERYSPEGKAPSRSWSIPIPRQGSWGRTSNYVRHACPLPIELITRVLRLTTKPGDLVLDPFAGSGSVLAAAKAMGRRFVGTDLSPRYRKMFYADVLPMVLDQHNGKRITNGEEERVRRRFTSAVLALRCLKYPKELVRLYRREFGEVRCTSIFALPSKSRRKLTLVFCFSPSRPVPKTFLSKALAITERRPLSKYGIEAELIAVNCQSSLRRALDRRGVSSRRRLYVYLDGHFYDCARTASLSSSSGVEESFFRVTDEEAFPRVVSPVKLNIPPSKPERFFASENGR